MSLHGPIDYAKLREAVYSAAYSATLDALERQRPKTINSVEIVKDNFGGSGDLVEPLFAESTPSRSAVVRRIASNVGDDKPIYVGGPDSQVFPLAVGDALQLQIDDLAKVYVRVPPGVKAVLVVVWES